MQMTCKRDGTPALRGQMTDTVKHDFASPDGTPGPVRGIEGPARPT